MEFIPLPNKPTPPPAAKKIAEQELAFLNAELSRRVEVHKVRFDALWRNKKATADQILYHMGTLGALYFAAASESVGHMARLAAIIGKNINDYIPDTHRIPLAEVIINPDMTASLKWPEPTPPNNDPEPEPVDPVEPEPSDPIEPEPAE
jgi:hypothetical protein